MAQLKNAKEDDQASFMIAKKATARCAALAAGVSSLPVPGRASLPWCVVCGA